MKIYTDCDGVLLDWYGHFEIWMGKRGYPVKRRPNNLDGTTLMETYDISKEVHDELTEEFNSSAWIGFVPPLRDSVKYVRELFETKGVTFHVISSMGTDKFAHKLRTENLKRFYGEAITDFTYIPIFHSKEEVLSEWKNNGFFWIEDKPRNAQTGVDLGYTSILMNHSYNQMYRTVNVNNEMIFVNNWREIYELL